MAPQIELRLLGQYTLRVDDRSLPPLPTEKSRGLLAYLALHPGQQSRSHLIALFWPDLPEKSARRRLTQELWRIGNELSKAGVDGLFAASGSSVALSEGLHFACDALSLQQALARLAGEDPARWPGVEELTDLYRGELLPGFYDDWVLLDRERLFRGLGRGLERILAHHKSRANWADASAAAEALLQLDPLDEGWVAEAMQLTLALNRPDAGLAHFERYVQRLALDLESQPGPELTALADRLRGLRQRQSAITAPAFSEPGYQPPLLGREGERATLLAGLDQIQTGQGQIFLVEGPAGVGKSRLLQTIGEDARWRGLAVGWGAAQEIERNQPYAVLLQAVQGLLSPLRSQQLQVLLDPLWMAAATRLLPSLGEWLPDLVPPPPLEPEAERVRLLEALTRLILALGELSPSVLILDDLQWADTASLGALIYLSRRLADRPLLLLLAYRGEEARSNPGVWVSLTEIDRGSHPRRLPLSGISAAESAGLVRKVLGLTQPAPLFERRIFTQTQGNPFFILESLRALYQEGSLIPSPSGGWQTPWDDETVDYREMTISPEVAQLIERRLAHLLPEERQTLEAAAVLGATFDLSLLAGICPVSPRQTLAATATLVQRRFLQETATAYRFEHDQIRQTVYGQLTPPRRRQLHRQAGEALARTQPHAYGLLAHHFEEAGATGQAFHFHCQAGKQAWAAGSYPLADHHYTNAVKWMDQLVLSSGERVDLLISWEHLLDLLGKREEQAQALARLHGQKGLTPRQQGQLALRQANLLASRDEFEQALAAIDTALGLAQDLGDLALQTEALSLWGQLLNQVGDLPRAEEKLRRAAVLAEQVGDPRLHAETLSHLADILPTRNAYAEAIRAAETALARYQSLGDVAGEAHVNLTLAIIQVERGDVAGATERYAQALALTRQCGYRYLESRIAANMANALCILGRIGEALALYSQALTISREMGNARMEHLIAVNHGSTYLSFVGPDEAVLAQVRQAMAWGESVGDALCVGQTWNLLSMAAYYAGDLTEARAHLDRSIAAFEGVDYGFVKAQALRAQATLCQAEGKYEEALARISQALEISRAVDAPHLITEMRSIQGQALLSLGRLAEALAATGEAVAAADPNVFQSYLLHHRHFQALHAAGRQAEGRAALSQAVAELTSLLESLSPAQEARSREAIPAHRELLADGARWLLPNH